MRRSDPPGCAREVSFEEPAGPAPSVRGRTEGSREVSGEPVEPVGSWCRNSSRSDGLDARTTGAGPVTGRGRGGHGGCGGSGATPSVWCTGQSGLTRCASTWPPTGGWLRSTEHRQPRRIAFGLPGAGVTAGTPSSWGWSPGRSSSITVVERSPEVRRAREVVASTHRSKVPRRPRRVGDLAVAVPSTARISGPFPTV